MDRTAESGPGGTPDISVLARSLADLTGRSGFHRRLDDRHTATFIRRGGILLVTFEEVGTSLSRDDGLPLGCTIGDRKSWSVLHITGADRAWFRSDALCDFFDELAGRRFFDGYDRVLFYGAEAGGYAAAAYSAAAPQPRVLVVSPLATVDGARASWDDRLRDAPPLDAVSRFGFAPDMIRSAEAVLIAFDPTVLHEHVHSSLFQGRNVDRLACSNLAGIEGASLAETLERIGALHPLIEQFALGTLDRQTAYMLLRNRHQHDPYLRALLRRVVDRDGDRLVAVLCKAVLSRGKAPAFRKRLRHVSDRLEAAGNLPDWLIED